MGFLDVDIPDWLKPLSPGEKNRIDLQTMQQSLQNGIQLGMQQQMERDRLQQQLDFNKLKMKQDWEIHERQLDFDKTKWTEELFLKDQQAIATIKDREASYELNKMRIQEAQAETSDIIKLVPWGKEISTLPTADDVLSAPLPDGINSVKGMAAAEKLRMDVFNGRKALENVQRQNSARAQFESIANNYSKRDQFGALGAHMMSVLARSTGEIPEKDLDALKSLVTEAEEQSRLLSEQEAKNRIVAGGHPRRQLSAEEMVAYKSAIENSGKTIKEINAINRAFKLDPLNLDETQSTISTGGTTSPMDWLTGQWNKIAPQLPSQALTPNILGIRLPFISTSPLQSTQEAVVASEPVSATGTPTVPPAVPNPTNVIPGRWDDKLKRYTAKPQ